MTRRIAWCLMTWATAALGVGPAARAQTAPADDPIIRRLWTLGTDSSHTYELAQVLLDSIGPRLTGSPGLGAANDWVASTYRRWGVDVRAERYGSVTGWRRGTTHVDLVAPRRRTLNATLLPGSAGTQGTVEASVVMPPDSADTAAVRVWLRQARGKFVLFSLPEPTCRSQADWKEFATPASFERMQQERAAARKTWSERIDRMAPSRMAWIRQLDSAGVRGLLFSTWANGWGVYKIERFVNTKRMITLALSCEDYGLIARLAARTQGPVLRVAAEATSLGEVPVVNTIATIPGTEKPNEYVILSAHLDSWDAASGATDNGTGTVAVLEAMRLLRRAYPTPKRTIIAAHWSGEEQGVNGSRAFADGHPEIGAGLQALFNQDDGTGRTVSIPTQGFTAAADRLKKWLSALPPDLAQEITLPAHVSGGSDHYSFACRGLPAFDLGVRNWDYNATWHTTGDTFDKIVFDDLRATATLIAMLAYQASEDPERLSRDGADSSGKDNPPCAARKSTP